MHYPEQRPTAAHGKYRQHSSIFTTQSIAIKVCQAIQKLQDNSWFLARIRGSHRQIKHPAVSGLATLSGKRSQDIPVGTLRRILKQARFG